jgi:hypothetical protein
MCYSIRLKVIYINIACACQQNNILTIELQIQTINIDFLMKFVIAIGIVLLNHNTGPICAFYGRIQNTL